MSVLAMANERTGRQLHCAKHCLAFISCGTEYLRREHLCVGTMHTRKMPYLASADVLRNRWQSTHTEPVALQLPPHCPMILRLTNIKTCEHTSCARTKPKNTRHRRSYKKLP